MLNVKGRKLTLKTLKKFKLTILSHFRSQKSLSIYWILQVTSSKLSHWLDFANISWTQTFFRPCLVMHGLWEWLTQKYLLCKKVDTNETKILFWRKDKVCSINWNNHNFCQMLSIKVRVNFLRSKITSFFYILKFEIEMFGVYSARINGFQFIW